MKIKIERSSDNPGMFYVAIYVKEYPYTYLLTKRGIKQPPAGLGKVSEGKGTMNTYCNSKREAIQRIKAFANVKLLAVTEHNSIYETKTKNPNPKLPL